MLQRGRSAGGNGLQGGTGHRAYLDPDGQTIIGLLSVWVTDENAKGGGWVLHASRMPVGPPPE